MDRKPAMRIHTPPQMRRVAHVLPHMIVSTIVFIVALLAVLWFRAVLQAAPYRQTIVIAGSPTHILSVNAAKSNVTLIDIPEDTVISAVKGYGNYSVRSLITLDGIDTHHGTLVTASLSDAFGIPISWYVAPTDSFAGNGTVDMVRRLFSWGSIGRMLIGKIDTSVPISTWISLVWMLRFIPADAVEIVDVGPAIVPMQLPDGGSAPTLDESKLDFVLQNRLVDTGLRPENLTVAMYNTTQIASVGLRASRQLSRMGIQLVFVGNEDSALSRCVITGSDAALRSKTAQFIRSYFQCEEKEERGNIGKGTGADLIVELGSDYASQYK
ncbi:MAG: LytR C-terminal domain-containing protein [Patescibacteria group bacterium]